MDPNNGTGDLTSTSTPPQVPNGVEMPEMPTGEPTPPPPPPPNEGLPPNLPDGPQVSKPLSGPGKPIMIVIIVLVLGILGAGGFYYYSGMKAKEKTDAQNARNVQTAQEISGFGTELNSIDVADPEGDLKPVDDEITLLEATPSAR